MEAAVVGGEHREGAILRQLVMEARFLSKSVKLCQVHLLAGVNQTLNRNHCGGKQGAIDNSRSLTESSYQILKNKLHRVGDSVDGNVYCVSASEVIFKHDPSLFFASYDMPGIQWIPALHHRSITCRFCPIYPFPFGTHIHIFSIN